MQFWKDQWNLMNMINKFKGIYDSLATIGKIISWRRQKYVY